MQQDISRFGIGVKMQSYIISVRKVTSTLFEPRMLSRNSLIIQGVFFDNYKPCHNEHIRNFRMDCSLKLSNPLRNNSITRTESKTASKIIEPHNFAVRLLPTDAVKPYIDNPNGDILYQGASQ